jgi:diadenosine tetraphosphate (Ap4A) HIT family hydrolase
VPQPADIASRLLRFEQQLKAYEKLHADELAELWRTLNECKQAIAALADERANGPVSVTVANAERDGQNVRKEEGHETLRSSNSG